MRTTFYKNHNGLVEINHTDYNRDVHGPEFDANGNPVGNNPAAAIGSDGKPPVVPGSAPGPLPTFTPVERSTISVLLSLGVIVSMGGVEYRFVGLDTNAYPVLEPVSGSGQATTPNDVSAPAGSGQAPGSTSTPASATSPASAPPPPPDNGNPNGSAPPPPPNAAPDNSGKPAKGVTKIGNFWFVVDATTGVKLSKEPFDTEALAVAALSTV